MANALQFIHLLCGIKNDPQGLDSLLLYPKREFCKTRKSLNIAQRRSITVNKTYRELSRRLPILLTSVIAAELLFPVDQPQTTIKPQNQTDSPTAAPIQARAAAQLHSPLQLFLNLPYCVEQKPAPTAQTACFYT